MCYEGMRYFHDMWTLAPIKQGQEKRFLRCRYQKGELLFVALVFTQPRKSKLFGQEFHMCSSPSLKALSQNESVHTHLVSVGWLVIVVVDLCFSSHMPGTWTEGLVPEIDEQRKKIFQIFHLLLGMILDV